MSPHKELRGSLAAILNHPENVLEGEGSGHVIGIFQNVPGRPQGLNPAVRGLTQAPPRVIPGPPLPLLEYIKGKLRGPLQYSTRSGTTAHHLSSTGRALHGEGPCQEKKHWTYLTTFTFGGLI